MNADLQHALTALESAGQHLAHVAALPTEIGARIRWSNGLVWTRMGENEWIPEGDQIPTDLTEARAGAWTAPSKHIACFGHWTPEPPALDWDEERSHLVIEDDDGKPFLSGCDCTIARDHYSTEQP